MACIVMAYVVMARLHKQIVRDCQLMTHYELMDYSLLVGITRSPTPLAASATSLRQRLAGIPARSAGTRAGARKHMRTHV